MSNTNFIADLQSRGMLIQRTPDLRYQQSQTLYAGFDPSAGSLHAGSLVPLMVMDRYRRQGGQIIVLLGGATGLIGDPSGKDEERTLPEQQTVQLNTARLEAQARLFFAKTDGPEPLFLNNANWFREMNILTFLRDVGKHFSVNQMLARDSVKSRLETREQGISFTEFSYALLQAYDYLHLFDQHDCRLQLGASDQWGNICAGIDLIRRTRGTPVHGLTLPLMTNATGKKYGKSESGAVWLDPTQTSPFAFYQFWLGMDDLSTQKFLHWFSDEPVTLAPQERQRELATLMTRRVHGSDMAKQAREASEALFSGSAWQLDAKTIAMLTTAVPCARLDKEDAAPILEVLFQVGAATSKTDARRLIKQGGIRANGKIISDDNTDLHELESPVILSKGKSARFLVVFC